MKNPDKMSKNELRLEVKRLRDAMTLVVSRYDGGCESFITPSTCKSAGRTRDAKYGADQWCDCCVLVEALQEESDE